MVRANLADGIRMVDDELADYTLEEHVQCARGVNSNQAIRSSTLDPSWYP